MGSSSRTSAERRAERRQRLIDAATEIWSESGWAAVTMRGVCSRTGLNDRYFYEDFKTRDMLLVAAWDGMRNEMLGEVSATLAERVGQPPIETIRVTISMVGRADRTRSRQGKDLAGSARGQFPASGSARRCHARGDAARCGRE